MANKDLPDISIGDFAMDILNDMAKNPAKALKPALKESTIGDNRAPDVSDVDVPQDFVNLVVEGKKSVAKPQTPPKAIKESTEYKVQNLIQRFSQLVTEAKEVMKEMTDMGGATTTGNLGTGRTSKILKRLRDKRGKR